MRYIIVMMLVFTFGLRIVSAQALSLANPVKKTIPLNNTLSKKNAVIKKISSNKKTQVKKVTQIKKITPKKIVPVIKNIVKVKPVTTLKNIKTYTPSYDKPVEDYLNSHSGIENPLLTPNYNLPSGIY